MKFTNNFNLELVVSDTEILAALLILDDRNHVPYLNKEIEYYFGYLSKSTDATDKA